MTAFRLCAFLAALLCSADTAPQEPQEAPAEDEAAAPEPAGLGAFLECTLGDMMASAEAFATPPAHPEFEPLPVPARNPFLLLQEQLENRPHAEIAAEREAERSAEAAAQTAARSPPDDAALRHAVSLLRLSAVLVAPDGGTALIDGRLARLGEPLLEERVTITAISRQGVVLRGSTAEYFVPLPPPGAAPQPQAGAEETEEEP